MQVTPNTSKWFHVMLTTVSEIFPGKPLQRQVYSIFMALFQEATIQSISYKQCHSKVSERGFIETITIMLDREYVLKGRIQTLIAPSKLLKLPKIVEFTLDTDEGAMEIDHGVIKFIKDHAPIEYIPANNFRTMVGVPGSENECCEFEWSELSNRSGMGTEITILDRHTNKLDYCGKHEHSNGATFTQFYPSERIKAMENAGKANL